MSNTRPTFNSDNINNMESASERMLRKFREEPALPIGITALIGMLGVGAYKFKHRGNMSISFFLVQLRVAAQGMVVGALCIGIMVSGGKRIYNHFVSPKVEE